MTILSFFSLFASIVCFVLAVIIHYSNRQNGGNRIFVHLCVLISYWAFTDFMMQQAQTIEAASLWFRLGLIWPFTSVFLFHFSVVFTGDKSVISHKINICLNYVLALVFSLLQLGTNLMPSEIVVKNGFYSYSIPEFPWIFWFSTSWLFALSFLGIVVLTKHCLKQTGKLRKQASLVGIAFSIPFLISLISEMVPVLFDVVVPDFSALSTTILCFIVWFAISKYDLFTLDLMTASETIVSTMPDCLILVNQKFEIMAVNQRLTALFGYGDSELFSKHVQMLFVGDFVSEFLEDLSDNKNIHQCDGAAKTKSGNEFPVCVSASVVLDSDDELVGYVVVLHDITERKQMEQLLHQSEKMAALGQAATMVGHDLRNPLQAIQNASYCIRHDLKKKCEGVFSFDGSLRMLDIIEEAIAYSDNIVMDLKDFATERKPKLRTVDFNELVKDALHSTKLPENVKVIADFGCASCVNVDKAMVKRVFVNILTNGAQAMPDGGTFRISTTDMEEYVKVKFQDTGVGMTKKTLAKLFTPFFTTKAQGMGMGLAICKKFIELNMGCIEVDSEKGKGTTFAICLPVSLKQVFI